MPIDLRPFAALCARIEAAVDAHPRLDRLGKRDSGPAHRAELVITATSVAARIAVYWTGSEQTMTAQASGYGVEAAVENLVQSLERDF